MPLCRASCIQCMHAGKARKMGGTTSGRCLLSCPCQAEPEAGGGLAEGATHTENGVLVLEVGLGTCRKKCRSRSG